METKSRNLMNPNDLTATDIQLLMRRDRVLVEKHSFKCRFTGKEMHRFGISFNRGNNMIWNWFVEDEIYSEMYGRKIYTFDHAYNCNTGKSNRGTMYQMRIIDKLKKIANKQ